MKAIQEKGQELMRVLLLVARKLGCKTANLGLKVKKRMENMGIKIMELMETNKTLSLQRKITD